MLKLGEAVKSSPSFFTLILFQTQTAEPSPKKAIAFYFRFNVHLGVKISYFGNTAKFKIIIKQTTNNKIFLYSVDFEKI